MTRGPAALALLLLALPAAAQEATEPLSAIDWLSRSVTEETEVAQPRAAPVEPPIAESAMPPEITVTPLDSRSPDLVGTLSPAVTGLPRSLWSNSSEETVVTLIQAERADSIPAIQDLMITLMLAEADPPAGAHPDGRLFLARVDRLLDMGALDGARALLDAAGPEAPEMFRRWFDVALLTGTEDAACTMMSGRPSLAPTLLARVFCLAREGDWQAAALTLNTARALGDVSDEDDILLSRFLDAAPIEGVAPLPPPARLSPLVFRLREAIGEGEPTQSLPRAFSHADLRPTVAWRNRIEAAERLARAGAIPPQMLFDTYTDRTPAASGGVWDRATAIQDLVRALDADADPDRVGAALPAAWTAMQEARTEVAFAEVYGRRLAGVQLTGAAADLAYRIELLSPIYEAAAIARAPASADERFWQAVARGDAAAMAPDGSAQEAIAAGFAEGGAPEPFATHIAEGRLGEALLRAVSAVNQGLAGDRAALTDALLTFRAVGMEDVARRTALQALLLDRPA